MAIGSTISGQVGFAIETVAGTRQAPTKWAEVNSEGLVSGQKFIRRNAIGGGSAVNRPQTKIGQEPAGPIVMDAAAENIGSMLKLAFGTPATTGVGPYTHTFAWLLTTPLPTATFQVGRPTAAGTVTPWDYVGMMVNTWEMSVQPDAYVTMSYDLAGRRVVTDQTLATPTWPTLTPWTSFHATLSMMGGVECFDSLTIRGDNKLDMSAVVCGTNPGERRIRQAGRPMLGGTFDQDFEDMTMWTAFQAGTVGDLVLTLNAGATATLVITGRVQYVEDQTPTMGGPEQILKQSMPFEFVRDASTTDTQAFSIALTNSIAAGSL